MSVNIGCRESGYVNIDGAKVPFAESGEPDLSLGVLPIVANTGLNAKHVHWGELLPRLGSHVIAIDIPEGYDHPEDPTIAGYTNYMAKAAQAIIEDRYGRAIPFNSISWSWGTLVGQEMSMEDLPTYGPIVDTIYAEDIAASALTKVNSAVLMAGVPLGVTLRPWLPTPKNLRAWQAIGSADRSKFKPEDMYGESDPGNEELLKIVLGRGIDETSHDRQTLAVQRVLMSGSLAWRNFFSRKLGNGPDMLALHGRRDRAIPRDLARNLAKASRMEFREIDGNHLFPLEKADLTAEIIIGHFRKPKRRSVECELALVA